MEGNCRIIFRASKLVGYKDLPPRLSLKSLEQYGLTFRQVPFERKVD